MLPSILRAHLRDWSRTKSIRYRPDFHARNLEEFIAIRDGDVPVALLHRPSLALEMREFYPDRRARSTFEIQRPYHWPSFRGARLTACWWLDGRQCVCSTTQKIRVAGGGPRLQIRIEETFQKDETGSHTLEFYFDPELGGYAIELRADLALLHPSLVEVSNFHAQGVGQAWEEMAKLRHTVWSNARGGLTYFPHNPLTPNTPGNLDWVERRRVPVGGFLAFGTRAEFNPAIEILACHTTAIGFATCSCSYDEHFFMGCPTPLTPEGRYRWETRYRLVSLPPEFSRFLRRHARRLDFGVRPGAYHSWPYLSRLRRADRQVQPLDRALPFTPGRKVDFEQAICPSQFLAGHYWLMTPQPHGAVTWDRRNGYRSRSSLKLTGRTAAARIAARTCGPSIMIFDGRSFTFSGMVRTNLAVDARAWLQVEPLTFRPGDCRRTFTSRALTGRTGWTRREVRLTPPSKAAFLQVSLHLKGRGEAWFDDVELRRDDSGTRQILQYAQVPAPGSNPNIEIRSSKQIRSPKAQKVRKDRP